MIELPKLIGREFRPFDWYGWVMSIMGITLIAVVGSDKDITWFQKLTEVGVLSFITLEYFWRVAFGRVYKHVYYDTIIHKMYEVRIGEDKYFICAQDEDELKMYIDVHYAYIAYSIMDEYPVESFYKKELFQ